MNSTQTAAKHLSLNDELLHQYKSKCVCDMCGTNRYEMDVYILESGDTAAFCCDMTDVFDTVKGYK